MSALNLSAALRAVGPGLPSADINAWVPALDPELARADIGTPRRVAGILGQVAKESAAFTALEEAMGYSAGRMVQQWPSRFPTIAAAAPFANSPERLANHVYAGRLGNGNEASGDGWVFRGRGLIQLTGRDAYTRFGASIGMSPEDAAAYVGTHVGAARSACWFWNDKRLSEYADAWDIRAVTLRVSGSIATATERLKLSNAALAALAA